MVAYSAERRWDQRFKKRGSLVKGYTIGKSKVYNSTTIDALGIIFTVYMPLYRHGSKLSRGKFGLNSACLTLKSSNLTRRLYMKAHEPSRALMIRIL